MTYTSSSIKILKGLEACRVRPGMYIGNTEDGSGLHHMIYEVLDNSIDEHLEKHCSKISVVIEKSGYVSVSDDGRGIPVDVHETEGISAAIVIMTQLHAGGKFDQDSYKISGGLHGVGVSVVNALSEILELTIERDGKKYFIAFERGKPVGDIAVIGESANHGTCVRFLADSEIFSSIEYETKVVTKRLEELAYLNPGLKIDFKDERSDYAATFCEPDGIVAFVRSLLKNKTPLHDIVNFTHKDGNMYVSGAIVWTSSYSEEILCFTNTIPQKDGGSHLVGLKTSLTRCINTYIQKDAALVKRMKDVQPTGDDIREGVECVLTVYFPEPQFSSQTKEKLVSASIRPVVEEAVSNVLGAWLEENPIIAKQIVQKIINASIAREAARKSRDLVRNNKSTDFSLSLATKLASCTQKDPSKTQLFIVEGDSAGGSAKMARNRMFQAVLPLRGKILNVEKANINKMLNDEGIRTLIAVIGTGIGDTFDITKIRYNKIILMTDADIDGSHILTLLITFFFKYMRQIIENGYLYVAQPPLYGVKIGGQMRYLLDDYALADFLLSRNLDKFKFYINDELQEDVSPFVKDLFNVANYIIGKGIIVNACLCEKISSFEEFNQEKVLQALNVIKPGVWTYENDQFIYEVNQLTYKYSFVERDLNGKYIDFVANWSDFWGENVKIVYDDGVLVGYNPIDIYNLFSNKGGSSYHIQRYKGLGEMNPEDLSQTAMQSYLQVRYDNEQEACDLIEKLMGEDVLPRKIFIQQMDPIESDD